ncbi:hypothetical protein CR205_15500 [Alteribacter lacisalsi]|uniref:DUF4190 domain-containing protein n=1 Tax=Alteribacter lacisalsi TaxID=2045244 RepID=A0A2W0HFX7_9BACI|nr:hypothetical protein [Alteribacter lacisalsi]PYZ95792.1 hypothetical protein CR205_15500 [Alteribacter lacisalsi]
MAEERYIISEGRRSGWSLSAYLSLAFGIASLAGTMFLSVLTVPGGLTAILLAVPGRKSVRRSLATAGMVLGILSLMFMLLYFILFFGTLVDLEEKIIDQI